MTPLKYGPELFENVALKSVSARLSLSPPPDRRPHHRPELHEGPAQPGGDPGHRGRAVPLRDPERLPGHLRSPQPLPPGDAALLPRVQERHLPLRHLLPVQDGLSGV